MLKGHEIARLLRNAKNLHSRAEDRAASSFHQAFCIRGVLYLQVRSLLCLGGALDVQHVPLEFARV